MTIEEEFTVELRGTIQAARERGYIPTQFIQMLDQYGGVGATKRLIAKSEPQVGFLRLWELGLLTDSMEAVMLRSRFRHLFADEELAEAKHRLEQLDFDVSTID